MAESLRREVLQVFKKLHRTRLRTFEGDAYALQVTRSQINKEYRKNKNVTDQAAIEELNKFAREVEHEIRTNIIQAMETAPGRVGNVDRDINETLRITPDVLIDNMPYKNQEDMIQVELKCKGKPTTPKEGSS